VIPEELWNRLRIHIAAFKAHALRYTRDCILKVFFPQDAPFSEVFSWLIAKIPLWRQIPKIVGHHVTAFVPPP
jgi:hypothetical protein